MTVAFTRVIMSPTADFDKTPLYNEILNTFKSNADTGSGYSRVRSYALNPCAQQIIAGLLQATNDMHENFGGSSDHQLQCHGGYRRGLIQIVWRVSCLQTDLGAAKSECTGTDGRRGFKTVLSLLHKSL